MSYMYQIFQFFAYEMLDNHKQTLRLYCQNHIRSILQSVSYVEDSQKLSKGRLVKPQRYALWIKNKNIKLMRKKQKQIIRKCRTIRTLPREISLVVSHCVISVRIRSFSGPYFSAFGLNTDQKNSEYGHFSCIVLLMENGLDFRKSNEINHIYHFSEP